MLGRGSVMGLSFSEAPLVRASYELDSMVWVGSELVLGLEIRGFHVSITPHSVSGSVKPKIACIWS